jgi:hypothetical protein
VTRVQLVDVDVPDTQQLIEPSWSRLYFQQGVPVIDTSRALDVTINGNVSSLVLPLPLDAVRSFEIVEPGVTRVFTTLRAPSPIVPVAEVWKCLPGGQGLRIHGVPGFHDGFLLTEGNVRSGGSGTMGFEVLSYDFSEALTGSSNLLVLTAAPIPGPTFLAAILSKLTPGALASQPLPPLSPGDCSFNSWLVQFQYVPSTDKFIVYTRFPRHVEEAVLSGPLCEYLGYGSFFPLEVCHDSRSPPILARNGRFMPKDAYARLETDTPRHERDIAINVQNALNAYTWPSFTFGVQFPGEATALVVVPAGRMTLRQLAESITSITQPTLGVYATYISSECGTKSGLKFANDSRVFGLDFAVSAPFDTTRIGYDHRVLRAAVAHYPIFAAVHIPLPSCASPPMCNIWAVYNEDTQHMLLQSVPFEEFSAVLSALPAYPNVFSVSSGSTTSFKHGLQVGARVIVVDEEHDQFSGVVVGVRSLTTFDVLLFSPDEVVYGAVTVVPQDRLPIDLFLTPRENVLPAQIIGFQPITYESSCDLLSPGTLDIREDPYLLLCLSFQAEGSSAPCGNMYYSFPNNTQQLVFGKVLRSSCAYKCDYDRIFSYEFRGVGIHLGYIQVRFLNLDGTVYETHGHSTSVCLKFDVKQSGVDMNAAGTVVEIPPPRMGLRM